MSRARRRAYQSVRLVFTLNVFGLLGCETCLRVIACPGDGSIFVKGWIYCKSIANT